MVQGQTAVFAIFGDPIAHSLSPVMQNAALQQEGIDGIYVPFRVRPEDLPAAVESIRTLHLAGINVTVPHKEKIVPFCDDLDEDARLIGAVNTVVPLQGKLIGYNTDGIGFITSLQQDLDLCAEKKRILLLGAGGACRAALVALCRAGAARVAIANRNFARAAALVNEFSPLYPGTLLEALPFAETLAGAFPAALHLLVNTTSVGLKGETLPGLNLDALSTSTLVYDMVYAQGSTTPLVEAARQKGIRAVDGLGMLAGQGEEAFRLWTSRCLAPGTMRRALELSHE
ncbi:MAG: shikimate dehydrogenase [Desulfuromonas sp.]|nr:MAG: shikimate dehydrogenase [Desulfuromonas sp.]